MATFISMMIFILKIAAAVVVAGIVAALAGIAIRENKRNNNE